MHGVLDIPDFRTKDLKHNMCLGCISLLIHCKAIPLLVNNLLLGKLMPGVMNDDV